MEIIESSIDAYQFLWPSSHWCDSKFPIVNYIIIKIHTFYNFSRLIWGAISGTSLFLLCLLPRFWKLPSTIFLEPLLILGELFKISGCKVIVSSVYWNLRDHLSIFSLYWFSKLLTSYFLPGLWIYNRSISSSSYFSFSCYSFESLSFIC